MRVRSTCIALVFLTCVLVGCQKDTRNFGQTDPDSVAWQDLNSVRWADGTGTFAGGRVAILSADEETGAQVLLLDMPKKALVDAHGGKAHSHTSTSHTYVIKGSVSAEINGRMHTANQGEYFRLPAGVAHRGSVIPDGGATMLIFAEGSFDTTFVDDNELSPKDEPVVGMAVSSRTAIHSSKSATYAEGSGLFKGGQIALLADGTNSDWEVAFFRQSPGSPSPAGAVNIHSHDHTMHTYIIDGAVRSQIDGDDLVGRAGHYFRMPAGVEHGESQIEDFETTMLIFIERAR